MSSLCVLLLGLSTHGRSEVANTSATETSISTKQLEKKPSKLSILKSPLKPWVQAFELGYMRSEVMNTGRTIFLNDTLNRALADIEIIRRADAQRAVFYNHHTASLPKEKLTMEQYWFRSDESESSNTRFWLEKHINTDLTLTIGQLTSRLTATPSDISDASFLSSDVRSTRQLGLSFSNNSALSQIAYVVESDENQDSKTLDSKFTYEFFGGLSSVALELTRGWAVLRKNLTQRAWDKDLHQVRAGFEQIVSPSIKLKLEFRHASESGFLENPYRAARVAGALLPESLPDTRTSSHWLFTATRYIEPRFVMRFKAEQYKDSWGVDARAITVHGSYNYRRWNLDTALRYYSQDESSLYSNNAEANILGSQLPRHYTSGIEYSAIDSSSIHLTASYTLPVKSRTNSLSQYFENLQIQISENLFSYDRENYTPIASAQNPGNYSQHVHLLQFTITGWF